MWNVKIVFYESHAGELKKVNELFRFAEKLSDLVENPPDEFFEMLKTSSPVNGWAEFEENRVTAYIIFSPTKNNVELERESFTEWLQNAKPGDFRKPG